LIGDAMISVTGTIGRSLSEADRTLQARKTQRKAQHETFSGK
jgi:hypothetical protein